MRERVVGRVGTTDGKGFPTSYQEPSADYILPSDKDPNFEILKWVQCPLLGCLTGNGWLGYSYRADARGF